MTTPPRVPAALLLGVPGDKLAAPMNAPPAGVVASGVQPGVTGGIVLAQYVIVFGTTGGVFIYSGTPALGNAPLYWMGNVTADPYGNAVFPGIWAGQSTGPQVGLQVNGPGSELLFPLPGAGFSADAVIANVASGSGGIFQIAAPRDTTVPDRVIIEMTDNAVNGVSAEWFILYEDATGGLNEHAVGGYAGVNLPVVAGMSAVAPGTGTSPTNPAGVEPWHLMSLSNGWAIGGSGVFPQYRLVPSPPNSVEIIGSIIATAATSTTFCTLPSGYRPSDTQQLPAGCNAGVSTTAAPFVTISPSGVLSTFGMGIGAANTFVFHGTFSLDA